MAQPLDRATRKIVTEYGNAEEAFDGYGEYQARKDAAGTKELFEVLKRLLDECNTAEVNAAKGRRAFVSVGRIRQLIAEGLS